MDDRERVEQTGEDLFLEGLAEGLTDTIPVEEAEPEAEATADAAEALEQTAQAVVAAESAETGETGETGEAAAAGKQEPTVHIKFNHEERDIPLEEAARLAQKGLKLESELEKMRSSPEFAVLDQMAKASGLTREQYVKRVQQLEQERQARAAEEMVRRQYPDAPDELIRETAASRRNAELERERQRKAGEAALRNRLMEEARSEAQNRDLTAFLEAYPDIRDFEREIPDEVWKRVRGGESLLPAYRAYENEQLRAKLEQLEQNERNRERSIGSMTGAGDVDGDAFLEGLFS